MRFRTALCLASIVVFWFTGAAWSAPIPDRPAPDRLTMPPDYQLLSGKISAIGDAAFSLEVMKGQEQKGMEFSIDGDTKVESKLEVGSQAKVEYRFTDGRNVAVHTVVTPTSGMGAR